MNLEYALCVCVFVEAEPQPERSLHIGHFSIRHILYHLQPNQVTASVLIMPVRMLWLVQVQENRDKHHISSYVHNTRRQLPARSH
jgi:hypothetical protein